jgi:DNA-binding NarL/FixJ family response regulator
VSIRVVVVDDQALVRGGLAMVFNHQDDIEVVAEAATGAEAIDAARVHRPDVILMDIPPAELVAAVRTVADGGALLAPSITRRLIGQFAERLAVDSALTVRIERLTEREREVLTAIARGSSNAEIGEELFIGAATVKSHVSSILTKLGLRDRAQIVVFAYESGLVRAGDLDIGH